MSDCHSCVNEVVDSGCGFLSPESTDNVSRTIEIEGDYAYILKGYNLQPGQHAIVELISGHGDGQMFVPFIVNGRRMELNTETTLLVLKNTGRYRVVVVDAGGNPVNPGLLMPTICAERADSSCGCSEGTELEKPPCPPVTISLDASVKGKITATVTGGPGEATITPGGLKLLGNGPFDFESLDAGKQYSVVFVSDCGSKAGAAAVTLAEIVAPVYCPSFRYEDCDCNEAGFGYRDNPLKDPAATVKVTACDGEAVMWIYPAAGMTGTVRHEIPYFEDGLVLGYMANNSDCAPPVTATTIVNVAAPSVNVEAPVVNNSPVNNITLPAPNVVAADWVGIDGTLKITKSDGTSITTDPIPACDN